MPISPLPTPPSISDPANFATRADSFIAALPQFVTECNAAAAGSTIPGGGTMTGNLLCLNTGLAIKDTGGAQSLILKPNEVLTGQRTLSIIVNNADRSLTISGTANIDQDVRVAGTPTFAALTVAGNGGPNTPVKTVINSGSHGALAAGAAATAITMIAGQSVTIQAFLTADSTKNIRADAFYDGTTLSISNKVQTGASLDIIASGANLQYKNASGSGTAIGWSVK